VPALALDGVDERRKLEMLGLFNSKLLGYHLRSVCPPKLGGFTRFTSSGLNDSPLVLAPEAGGRLAELRRALADLAEELVEVARESERVPVGDAGDQSRREAALYRDLDRLVFDLHRAWCGRPHSELISSAQSPPAGLFVRA
jgi:hypothetical protein